MNTAARLRSRRLLWCGALPVLMIAFTAPATAQATLYARVSVKRVLDPGSTPKTPWALGTVHTLLQDADRIFTRAGIRLDLIEIVDIVDSRRPSSWFKVTADKADLEREALRDPARYRWRNDAINIYLVRSIDSAGGVCSFSPDGIILVANQNARTIAHEIGHFFNLRHTHANHESSAGECPGRIAGDCCWDTPDDANPPRPFDPLKHYYNFLAFAKARYYSQEQIDTVLNNLMSYHRGTMLTDGQANRAKDMALAYRRNVLQWQTSRLVVQEFTGDGRDDIFIHLGATGTNRLLRTNGYVFTALVNSIAPTAVNDEPNHVIAGDFNGNGMYDLLFFWSRNGMNRVVLGTGGGFGTMYLDPIPTTAVNGEPALILTGDFDDVAGTDLWFYWRDGTNRLALSRGGSSFKIVLDPIPRTAINDLPSRIVAGDFNNDHRTDLLWYWGSTGRNHVAIQSGVGAFTIRDNPIATTAVNDLPDNVLVGDYDGDGRSDVLWHWNQTGTNKITHSFDGSRFVVLDNPIEPKAINESPDDAFVGDFDGNGRLDVLWYWRTSGRNRLTLSQNGPFRVIDAAISPASINGHPDLAQVADFNGDDLTDLVVGWSATGELRVEFSRGDGSFWEQKANAGAPAGMLSLASGTSGKPVLTATSPVLGGSTTLTATAAPSPAMALLLGSASVNDPAIGLPGLYANLATLAISAPMAPSSATTWSLKLNLPASPALEGIRLLTQAVFLSMSAPPELSSAVELVLGY